MGGIAWVLCLQFLILPLIWVVVKGLGFYLITVYGIPDLLTGLHAALQGQMGDVPSNILGVLYLFGFDTGIRLIFGAYGVAYTLRGISTSMSRWTIHRPAGI